ncbi:hypothetical protein [Clostridium tetani]|nr:hypothetical protein [Clostridium tetani]CDI50880.1 hypothetical protein BN906_02931 [Clostridium tetani 12124569]
MNKNKIIVISQSNVILYETPIGELQIKNSYNSYLESLESETLEYDYGGL